MKKFSVFLFLVFLTSLPLFGSTEKQMVMDDPVTFFDAEPVQEYDSALRLQKDVGWYLKSTLRILGTFPDRSAFKIVVKKDGAEQATVRCEGEIYRKANDVGLRTEIQRRGRDLSYEDFMSTDRRCFDQQAVIKPIGKMDVEVYFIDGQTDAETKVRTYKIDVHKATRVRGSPTKPQPDVSHYYIQRHAEAAVAVAYMIQDTRSTYFKKPIDNYNTPSYRQLFIYTSYTPQPKYVSTTGSFARCTVNGKPIDFSNNQGKDQVGISEDQSRREVAIYTDRNGAQFKRGSAYKDEVEFSGLTFRFPIFTGADNSSLDLVKLEDHAGSWECVVKAKGETIRTFRWQVANGKIVPHPEQTGGNVNLFYDAALIDMEIPDGGSSIDFRLAPFPNEGFFYGIPWSTAEGKAMAGRLPKKGAPFHVASK